MRRLYYFVRWLFVFAKALAKSNFDVVKLVLAPTMRIRPGFIEVPLELEHPDAVALLASIIAITPGTVVADVDDARTRILVHVLDLEDPEQLVAEIKDRYERPLKETVEC